MNISGIPTMSNIRISLKSFKKHIQILHLHSQSNKKTPDTTEIQMVGIVCGHF